MVSLLLVNIAKLKGVIMANTKIGDNVVIEKAIIGGDVIIRKNSKIGNGKDIILVGEREEIKANSIVE